MRTTALEGVRSPNIEVTEGCELPCRQWELSSGPLEWQPVILTTEPFLQTFPDLLNSKTAEMAPRFLNFLTWNESYIVKFSNSEVFRSGLTYNHSSVSSLWDHFASTIMLANSPSKSPLTLSKYFHKYKHAYPHP